MAEVFVPPALDEKPSVLQKLQKWGDYDACGEPVAPTRFLPMKTPLGCSIIQSWDDGQPPRDPLTLDILFGAQTARGRKIGMILDLSNHETLYAADLERYDTRYERVPLVAKILPTQQAINKVIEVADRFWSAHPEQYIAIHCAYGFNRTGFVVCSYLIQSCNLSVQEALDSFASARPPGVRHEQFVEELHRRYDMRRLHPAMPQRDSFSDLRGYGRQTIESLHSEFGAVAEHLTGTDQHLDTRDASRESSDVMGCSPPMLVHGGPSLTKISNCESVNNESLDLDEGDIFKHFASSVTPSDSLPIPSKPGRHRRSQIRGLHSAQESTSSSASNSPMRLATSPFSTIQDAEKLPLGVRQAEACAMPADSGSSAVSVATVMDLGETRPQSSIPAISNAQGKKVFRSGSSQKLLRPPLYPIPDSEGQSAKAGKSRWGGLEGKSSNDCKGGRETIRRPHRPCYIM